MVVVGGWAAAKLDETNSCTYIWINFCILELPREVTSLELPLRPRTKNSHEDVDVDVDTYIDSIQFIESKY